MTVVDCTFTWTCGYLCMSVKFFVNPLLFSFMKRGNSYAYFHRLFVLAAYGSLAIVLIAVLFPTAKGQSQHLASTRPWVGIAGTTFLTRSLIQTCVRQPTLQTGLVDYAPRNENFVLVVWVKQRS